MAWERGQIITGIIQKMKTNYIHTTYILFFYIQRIQRIHSQYFRSSFNKYYTGKIYFNKCKCLLHHFSEHQRTATIF